MAAEYEPREDDSRMPEMWPSVAGADDGEDRVRNISFALTTDQIRNRTKTVTRRLGWTGLKPGSMLQPVVKAQGLKKGERVEKIGAPIRVVNVRREVLQTITGVEVLREGFPAMTCRGFIDFFCEANQVKPWDQVT